MGAQLHITNGDGALHVLTLAGIEGDLLPWQDVLHEGPVPGGLSLAGLSVIRAEYIAQCGWALMDDALILFKQRDDVFLNSSRFTRCVLWFEHDLYDQLQLIQILHEFAKMPHKPEVLQLICSDNYLGEADSTLIKQLWHKQESVTAQHYALAQQAWSAFASNTPLQWAEMLNVNTDQLPYLQGAIERMLQEYPDPVYGLSRTQQTILTLLKVTPMTGGQLFGEYQLTEQRRFMGDSSFWSILHELASSQLPLIVIDDGVALDISDPKQMIALSEQGRSFGNQQINWLQYHSIDRWIGGTHLSKDDYWTWDREEKRLHHQLIPN